MFTCPALILTCLHRSHTEHSRAHKHCPYIMCLPLALPPPLGKVLSTLDQEFLTNETLVYFTSDNGGRLDAWVGWAYAGGWNGVYKGE